MENTLQEQYLTAAARCYGVLTAVDADAAHDAILAGYDAMNNRGTLPANLWGYLYAATRNRLGHLRQRYGLIEEPRDTPDGGSINPTDTLKIILSHLRARFGNRDVEIYVDRVCGEPPRDIAKRLNVAPVQIYRVMNKVKLFLATDPVCRELKRDAYD